MPHTELYLNIPEYGFSLTHIFPYKDRIVNSALTRKIRDRENPYCGTFCDIQLLIKNHSELSDTCLGKYHKRCLEISKYVKQRLYFITQAVCSAITIHKHTILI